MKCKKKDKKKDDPQAIFYLFANTMFNPKKV